jgi:molybdate transport system substrate-binding protein
VEDFKRAMLGATSIAHTVHGASGRYVPVLFERLGIAEHTKPKTVTRPGGYIGGVVASGEAEIAVQQIVELLAVPGIDIVGPLPEAIQKVFETSIGIFTASSPLVSLLSPHAFVSDIHVDVAKAIISPLASTSSARR